MGTRVGVAGALALGLLTQACGTSPSTSSLSNAAASEAGVLDCAWITGNNCWKVATASAVACLPPPTETGTLSADGLKCSYPNGTTVSFTTPQSASPNDVVSGLTVTTGGTQCVRCEIGTEELTVSTPGGTVTVTGDPATMVLTYTCPDGSSYTGNLVALNACMGSIPGIGSISTGAPTADGGPAPGTFGISFEGTSNRTRIPICVCNTP